MLKKYTRRALLGLSSRWRDGFGKGCFDMSALPNGRPNVALIKGWFDDTLPGFVKELQRPVDLLHIDCDLYSSTKTMLELLQDRIHPGCVIVFDEYFGYPGWEEGEYKAFQEFISRTGLKYDYIAHNRLHEQAPVKIKAA